MQMKTQTAKKSREFKNPAIAFDFQDKGAVCVTPTGLVWKNGAAQNAKNVTVKWDAFINWMQSQLPTQPKAKKPAKQAKTAAATSRNGISAKAKKAPAKSAISAKKFAPKKAH
jgi:hypothetical protein